MMTVPLLKQVDVDDSDVAVEYCWLIKLIIEVVLVLVLLLNFLTPSITKHVALTF